jgi:digeranylgeranylglycerophospholipid reductase
MKYDVVVVGGRVSGSVASLFASKNDVNVLMVEKQQEIGVPVQCAGGVSDSFFKTMEMKHPKEFYSRVEGASLHAPDGSSVSTRNKITHGYILERKLFDKNMAILSAESGTDIMLKTPVKGLIRDNGQVKGVVVRHQGKLMEIAADVVIAADGVESQVAKMAGLNTRFEPYDLCSCAQYEMVGLDINPNMIEFYFGQKIAPGGYVWVFPKGDTRANIGIGIRNSNNGNSETNNSDNSKNAHYYLQKFISKLNGTPVEFNVGAVPVSGPVEKTYTGGLLVVGDAAGQVDPVTGGGIHVAASCAKIAGIVAAEAVKNEDCSGRSLKKYEDTWKKKKKIGRNLRRSLKYRKIFDKLDDQDISDLIRVVNGQELESISKLALLKMTKEYPQILKLLRDIL